MNIVRKDRFELHRVTAVRERFSGRCRSHRRYRVTGAAKDSAVAVNITNVAAITRVILKRIISDVRKRLLLVGASRNPIFCRKRVA